MKFFWKLFFSISISVLLCVSIGGMILIQSNFFSSLERERAVAGEENDMLYVALERAVSRGVEMFFQKPSEEEKEERILRTISSVSAQSEMGEIPFCLTDRNGTVLYTNSTLLFFGEKPPDLEETEYSYLMYCREDAYYIQYTRSLEIYDEIYYVKTCKDISETFYEKKMQYHRFQCITGVLVVLCFLITLLVSIWLVRPVKRLSKATQHIAAGNYGMQVTVKGNDEIAMLTRDFNEMSDKLQQYVEELKDKTRRQELFTDNFAHELKTPMTSVIGYADMIRSRKLSEEDKVLYANRIVEEGKRLEKLSMKLMELVVLKRQNFLFCQIEAVDFFGTVSDTVVPMLKEKNIVYSTEAEAATLNIEPDLMKTVCINLIDNARKAVNPGGTIILRGRRTGNGYCIQVQDDGCGMKKEEADKVTEAFYMIDRVRTRENGGAGLGLAICAEIVKIHHGKLQIESKPGEGTQISIILEDSENEKKR